MGEVDEVRALFEGHSIGPACTDADIRRAEAALGEPLPAALRELYLAIDGFRGPTDARFFWPLFGYPGLVRSNQFFRSGEPFPRGLVSRCLFFGEDGCGPQWGFHADRPGRVIRWDAEWGDDFEEVGASPLEVWRTAVQWYASLDEES